MNSKPIKIPGPVHPITITPTQGRVPVVVTINIHQKRAHTPSSSRCVTPGVSVSAISNIERYRIPL